MLAGSCQLGQHSDAGDPFKKQTGFMSNAAILLKALDRCSFGRPGLCSRPQGGRRVKCLGKTAQREARFQEELCMVILRGLNDQLLTDRCTRDGELDLVEADGVMRDGSEDIEFSTQHQPQPP